MIEEPSNAPTGGLAGPPARAQFVPDDLLAERFRVVRFVAAGGMGEVYEADDLELQERVALKTIRAGVADDERALGRFRREIQLARRVTHPGVCRTYDVFRHRLPDGGGVAFLSMELLAGETLASRLRRGRLPFEEARTAGLQVASALAAAHDAGVLHRDLKSANIVLVPGEKGVRAVITDFGLARDANSPSGPEGLVGTPGYMSPEQVEGRGTGLATDLYALGVVLYEMVTGRLPTLAERDEASGSAEATPTSDAPLAAALARLQGPPPPPRSLAPELPSNWNAAILRCLERDPGARPASAHEVVRALAPRPSRWPLVLGTGLVLVALGGGVALERLRSQGGPTRRSIAVLGFRDLAGRSDTAWLGTALSEAITAELAAGGKLRTVPPETVARVRLELGLTDSGATAGLSRLRGSLGSDLLASGTYLAEPGGRLRVDVRVQASDQDETVASVSAIGTDTQLGELLGRIGGDLRAQLGITGAAPAAAGLLPAHPEAARAYAEGLARLRLLDGLAARDLLQQAVEREPEFPLAHAALADAWSALGHDARARESARRALDLASRLPRAEQLAVEARYREASHDWPQAIEVNRTLARFFPDDLEHGLRLAAAQTAGGQGRDALATLAALRRLPTGQDPRLDLAEADAAHALADERRSLAAALEAARKGQELGARLLVAKARFQQAWALRVLGELGPAAAACEEARGTFAAVGDRLGVARSLNLATTIRLGQGDLEGARTAAEQALAESRGIGHQTSVAGALNHLANLHRQRGELAEASRLLAQSLSIQRELGDRLEQAIALDMGAGVGLARGRLGEATEAYQQALAIRPQIGDLRGEAFDRTGLGRILLEQADLAGARPLLERALRIRREIGNKPGVADSLFALGELALLEGDLETARRHHEEAVALRLQTSGAPVAQARVAWARLLLASGDPAAALRSAREAREVLERVGLVDDAAGAHALEARALLAQQDTQAALPHVEALVQRASRTEQPTLRMTAALVAAQMEVAQARPGAARRRLAEAADEAARLGLRLRGLEVRLALARLTGERASQEAVERELRQTGLAGLLRQPAP